MCWRWRASRATSRAWVLFAGLALVGRPDRLRGCRRRAAAAPLAWIGYIGLVVVLYVALHMIWDGVEQLGWLKALGV